MRVLWTLILGCVLPSCTTVRHFPVSELRRLDGFDVHDEQRVTTLHPTMVPIVQPGPHGSTTRLVPSTTSSSQLVTPHPYRVVSLDGEPLDFNSDTPLVLESDGKKILHATLRSVHVSDDTFRVTTLKPPVRAREFSLARITRAGFEKGDFGRTALAAVLIPLAIMIPLIVVAAN